MRPVGCAPTAPSKPTAVIAGLHGEGTGDHNPHRAKAKGRGVRLPRLSAVRDRVWFQVGHLPHLPRCAPCPRAPCCACHMAVTPACTLASASLTGQEHTALHALVWYGYLAPGTACA